MSPGSLVNVRVVYKGKPPVAKKPPWSGGFTWEKSENGHPWVGGSCQGNGAHIWYPCKEHPSDKADSVDIYITVQKPLKVASNGIEEFVELAGGKGIADQYETFNVSGLYFSIKYGSLLSQIPFNIKLNDFIAEKYPGTEKSYSSFMSKVSVDGDQKFDYDIYMNHILNHVR